jgi:hypothetical protein
MKVKVKHIQQPHQAHRVDVPNRTLGDLRSAVVGTLAFTEGAAAADVSISLNKKVRAAIVCLHAVGWPHEVALAWARSVQGRTGLNHAD